MPKLTRRFMVLRLLLVTGMFAGTGCRPYLTPREYQLQQDLDAARAELEQTQSRFATQAETIDALRTQLKENERLASLPLDQLFLVDRIAIVQRSGGADLDDKPGDDAIIVYVRPLDADGNVLKTAGQITVQLLDLTAPGNPEELGRVTIAEHDRLRKLWYGGLLTDYYRIVCKFSQLDRMPRAREVYIRVTFVDWLTGRTFTDSKTVSVQRVNTVTGALSSQESHEFGAQGQPRF